MSNQPKGASKRTEQFFSELTDAIDQSYEEIGQSLARFFNGLTPRFEASRYIDKELNRELAHHFNIFDYLRNDELGLSAIIADLLNPNAKHGQGPIFLKLFLERLEFDEIWKSADLHNARIATEETIESSRRIDIYVRIPCSLGPLCLVIENKPFAGDQSGQVQDYLAHLRNRYGKGRFRLIFLSGDGRPPSNDSLNRKELMKFVDNSEFLIMAYNEISSIDEGDGDEFERFRTSFTLVNWFESCRISCRPDKLRLLLREAESYCRRKFGDHKVMSNREIETVDEFLRENPQNLNVALAVFEAWPSVRHSICKRFLEHLRDRVEREIRDAGIADAESICVKTMHPNEKAGQNKLLFYSTNWRQHEGSVAEETNGRTSVMFENYGNWLGNWIIGVRSPSPEIGKDEEPKRRQLEAELTVILGEGKKDEWWLWRKFIDPQYANWQSSRVQDLATELMNIERGEPLQSEVSEYVTREFVELARKTFEVISEAEGVR